MSTHYTAKAKFMGTNSFSRNSGLCEKTDCFTTHYDYRSLHPYGAFPPAAYFSIKEGTQITVNETNIISTAVSAINQTAS